MTRRCVIEGCTSKSGSTQHRGVTFHSFPFDSKTREVWLINCKISPDKNITKSVLVCSRHFRRADFQPIKANKYLLKQGSVPTIFPWGKLAYVEPTNDSLIGVEGILKPETSTNELIVGESTIKYESSGEGYKSDSSFLSSTKRIAEEINSPEHQPKLAKLSFNGSSPGSTQIDDRSRNTSSSGIAGIAGNRKADIVSGFTPGIRIEAQDFHGIWHTARVVEVDNDEREVLIRVEKPGKGKTSGGGEEWIPMNSSRLRQRNTTICGKSSSVFILGEKCFARWSGSRRFPATINKVLPNDTYEVLFDDGYTKEVKGVHITKLKSSLEKIDSKIQIKAAQTETTQKSKIIQKKDWPLISISSLNLDELNLPKIPQDGEWCCHWVNDQPIGQEGFLTVGDHSKPTVIVKDWRLPPDWTKHMYQRSNVLGKWDVILINPSGKRFRSKADLKQYIEDFGQQYNPDVYDFSIHRRRAKDIGAYVFTKDYKAPSATTVDTQASTSVPTTLTTITTHPLSSAQGISGDGDMISKQNEDDISPLEDGYVYVGSLKVQIVDNLFRCPQDGCNKNFRKENHLQIHIKHYHDDIAKLLGVCPNMQDLACKRTIGHPAEEPLPKNHLPNAQFFAKLHQQDLQTKVHRKSVPAVSHVVTEELCTPLLFSLQDNLLNSPITEDNKVSDIFEITRPQNPTGNLVTTSAGPSTPTIMPQTIGVGNASFSGESKSNQKSRKSAGESSNRKSSRQRLTKKYLSSNSSRVFEGGFGGINDFEETRHSFNGTPENRPLKKPKLLQTTFISDTNIDANSHTTGSIPETSQSPKYISENGEIIKIVRMRQEEIINCLCSYGEEDGLMIQCELCLCWQHGICNGIEKESQVPEKYVCCICRNPERGRLSLKYIHDQDWMYEGKLPVANYHAQNPEIEDRFDILRKTHTLTGNLLELKKFLHSLKVKINIAENKDHPKMYLWAKKWELSPVKEVQIKKEKIFEEEEEQNDEIKAENKNDESNDNIMEKSNETINQNIEKQTIEIRNDPNMNQPTIPQPEAPIDPVECQHRLLEHLQQQQICVMDKLQIIESQIMQIESFDECSEMDKDCSKTKQTLAMLINDLENMKNIAKINTTCA